MIVLLLTLQVALHPATPLALTILTHPVPHFAESPADAWTLANAVESAATPLVSARLLLAVGFVESTWHHSPDGNTRHCGTWQQNPAYSAMWGDACWKGDESSCRQPGSAPVDCEELTDQFRAAVIAARHLTYTIERRGLIGGLCRYHGAPSDSERCRSYTRRVCSAITGVCP
jgi:hypothetical protein